LRFLELSLESLDRLLLLPGLCPQLRHFFSRVSELHVELPDGQFLLCDRCLKQS
jgi:hypothetical protein